MQKRWQSQTAWVAILALVGFVLGNWGLFDKIGLTDATFKTMAELILAALAAFGVFNNPTDKGHF